MPVAKNLFKAALADGRVQIGLWLGLASAYTSELAAGSGFDWLVIDGEHAPNDIPAMLAQLQAIAAYPGAHAIARVPVGEAALIKQYLDIGAQTLLVPMVDTAEQAAHLVRACRYPQDDGQGGIRGMAGARASRWGRYPNYAKEANDRVCLLVQAETRTALQNLDAIAATPGVDGVFIGPADLSASLSHVGDPNHPDVQAAIEDAAKEITGETCIVHAAGRTDAGVHATGQVAHADLTRDWDPFRLSEALNWHLKPAPVAVLAAARVDDDFHARFSALERRYLFRLIARRAPVTHDRGRVWQVLLFVGLLMLLALLALIDDVLVADLSRIRLLLVFRLLLFLTPLTVRPLVVVGDGR